MTLAENSPALGSPPSHLESKRANMSSSAEVRARLRDLQTERDRTLHQQQLAHFSRQNSFISHNHLVRAQGDCGADTLALLINGPSLTESQWQAQRALLSQAHRLHLSNWLMANENTPLPGNPDITFGQIYRFAPPDNPNETW